MSTVDSQTSKVSAALKKSKKEVFSSIDAAVSLCDGLTDLEMNTNSISDYGSGPFNFLLRCAISLGMYNELLEFLEKYLIYSLPALEVSVKGILLSNLVTKISCIKNVRIPDEFRLSPYNKYNMENGVNLGKGFLIDINSIDYLGILSYSPLSDVGKNLYFGNTDSDDAIYNSVASKNNPAKTTLKYVGRDVTYKSPHEFLRADDMNCFLWYVIHYTQHPSVKYYNSSDGTLLKYFSEQYGSLSTQPSSAVSLSDYIKISGKSNYEDLHNNNDNIKSISYGIVPGSMFSRENSYTVSMCVKTVMQDATKETDSQENKKEDRIWSSYVLPCAIDDRSSNWYSNPSYTTKSVVSSWNKNIKVERDYSKDIPLLYCRYYDSNITTLAKTSRLGKTTYSSLQNKLQMAVLPKPFEFKLNVDNYTGSDKYNILRYINANFFNIRYALFNEKGEMDQNGHYSCLINDNQSSLTPIMDGNIAKYKLDGEMGYLCVMLENGTYFLTDNNNIIIKDDINLSKILYQCYPKMTIYSLFYDLISGIKIFDAKTLASEIINTILSLRAEGSISISLPKSRTIEKINNIIKNFVENDGSEIDDCFYNFSNDRFSEMIANSENKRKSYYSFEGDLSSGSVVSVSGINDILSEYSDDATKEENKEVLHRAFTSLINNVTEKIGEKEKGGIKSSLIIQLLQSLLNNILQNIISPKIAVIFEMQKQLMGDKSDNFTFDMFMKNIENTLYSIIDNVGEMILNELYKQVVKKISVLTLCSKLKLEKEKLEKYMAILNELRENCMISLSSNGGEDLDTTIEDVNNADIYNTPISNEECQ
jgi:hypothetical protein